MTRPSIGERELALLRYIGDHGEMSVGEATVEFGQPLGLARSTVLTMMERLRAKDFLKRRRVRGVYHYSVAAAPGAVVRQAVGRFVENTLGGSVSPFVAWMAESGKVSDAELVELRALVAKLGSGRKGK
ncbi:MAG TPA: BlaI/MecI/CopY family transcriptional regulator [Rhodanobacteraceae bacterium]|nr:BlaI/MecI/CopY family transcriptional regulator [Rhodanobacteraceae bacterium]